MFFSYKKNLDNAKKAYQKAIALKPHFANAHFNYARLLIELENYHQAIAELKRTVAMSSHHSAAFSQLAHVYMYLGDFSKAITYYEKRLALEPENADAQYDCGLAHLKDNQFQKAIDYFTNALLLNPEHPDCHYSLATAYLQRGDHKEALLHYLRQLEKKPQIECYYNVGVLHMYQERHREAIDYFKQALTLDPNYREAHLNIAAVYLKINQIKQAIEHYESTLVLKPNDSEIEHILTALQKKEAPPRAPDSYVRHLFDEYATYYDQHLTLHLQYQVPQKLYQAVETEWNGGKAEWRILDLGCGTGLCGELFKPMAKELIGIDVSEKMLITAGNKNIYDKLENQTLQEALNNHQGFNLILAGDVFTYIGELDDIFEKVKKALAAKGLFALTVEKTHQFPYELLQTIRYAHSKKYIIALIKRNNFKLLRFDNIVLRNQKGKAIEGYLVLLGL